MFNLKNQKGFGVIEIILVVAIIGAIAFVGWRIYQSQYQPSTTSTEKTDQIPQVESASDLKKSQDYLQDTNVDGTLSTSDIDETLQ